MAEIPEGPDATLSPLKRETVIPDDILSTPESISLTSAYRRLAGWLNGSNAELSPKRYWRRPRSQKEIIPETTLSPPDLDSRWWGDDDDELMLNVLRCHLTY